MYGQNLRRDEQKKSSYERRVYECVDDNSLSYDLSQKPTKKGTHARVKQNKFLFNLFNHLNCCISVTIVYVWPKFKKG